MKPNLQIVKESAGCERCIYSNGKPREYCDKPKVTSIIDLHCHDNRIIYIETPRYAPTIPDSK